MKKIVAIGGVDPEVTLDLIEKEIVDIARNKNPRMLYLPTAGGDSERNLNIVKNIFEGQHQCVVTPLYLIKEEPSEREIREKVFSSDIIYIGGGSVSTLMNAFKKHNMDKILKEACEKGIVLAGVSAGAICWGGYWYDEKEVLKDIDCLKFVDIIFCPHYNKERFVNKFDGIVCGSGSVGVAIENSCAVEFVDDRYRVLSSAENANAYRLYKKGNDIIKEVLPKDLEFRDITELVNI